MDVKVDKNLMIKRLYGYLMRFRDQDRLKIDVVYVMANIVFGDTDVGYQDIIRRFLKGWTGDYDE